MAGFASWASGFLRGFTAPESSSIPDPVALAQPTDPQVRGSLENPATPLSDITSWESFFGGGEAPTFTGINISPDTALKVSAVYRAVGLIAENVARMDISVYRETNMGREVDKRNAFQKLLESGGPDEYMTWFDFWLTAVAQTLLHGNAYALIDRDAYATPLSIRLLAPGQCVPIYMDLGRTRYLYYTVFGEYVEKRNILHFKCLGNDGVIGKSPIALFRESIGLARAAEEYGARFFGQGGNMSGTLETDQVFKDAGAIERLRQQFAQRNGGLLNAHKPLVLEQGMKYNRVAIPPDDAQFIETRNFQIEDIGRIFGVPQHMLGKLDRSTNNNIEHQGIEFKNYTILPWTERISQELKRKLIPEDHKASRQIVFDVDKLDAGDATARGNLYKTLFNIGAMSPNEARRKENMNRREGLDDTFIQVNMARVTPDSHQHQPQPATPNPGNDSPTEDKPSNEAP
ncbi:HK97 family phage portal protein [Fibrisoma limi BUZ 3]|uniref:HK97 family phage portal protein n=1 Tax=Fibrisoma limi BUZ 3 TaxID=1185876 RepID=I2GKQ0_9BACT|nr:phage portal protein [Fibrisoma limi]CCH54476.1 HK97 family phage portal protein [Fibrisoma limi BUZ 3]